MPKSLDQMGTLQRRVMETLWRIGEGSVHDVLDAFPAGKNAGKDGDDKPPAYTTVLTVLQKLREAGWVTSRTEGRSHVFEPVRSREQEGARTIRGLVDRVFKGDAAVLVQHLLDDKQLSEDELDSIRQMIDQRLDADENSSEGGER